MGCHSLKAQTQLPGISKAQDLCAARIGAEVTANGAAALRSQTEGEIKARLCDGLLQRLQHTAGFNGHGEIFGVDGADAVHAPQAQNDLGA